MDVRDLLRRNKRMPSHAVLTVTLHGLSAVCQRPAHMLTEHLRAVPRQSPEMVADEGVTAEPDAVAADLHVLPGCVAHDDVTAKERHLAAEHLARLSPNGVKNDVERLQAFKLVVPDQLHP